MGVWLEGKEAMGDTKMVPTYAPTRWEIAIEKQGLKFRVCYSARKTQSALRDALFAIPLPRRLEIFGEVKTDGNFVWDSKAKEYRAADGCRLHFTGATERDIKNAA